MSHLPIIDRWPNLSEFAGDIGQSYNTAKAIRRRGWIPDWYWDAAVRGAQARGLADVTLERLAELSKHRAPNQDDPAQREADAAGLEAAE